MLSGDVLDVPIGLAHHLLHVALVRAPGGFEILLVFFSNLVPERFVLLSDLFRALAVEHVDVPLLLLLNFFKLILGDVLGVDEFYEVLNALRFPNFVLFSHLDGLFFVLLTRFGVRIDPHRIHQFIVLPPTDFTGEPQRPDVPPDE